jgi:hypothetical protein
MCNISEKFNLNRSHPMPSCLSLPSPYILPQKNQNSQLKAFFAFNISAQLTMDLVNFAIFINDKFCSW